MIPPAFTIIDNAEIYTPQPIGRGRIVIGGQRILAVAPADASFDALARGMRELHVELETIDADECIAVPGLIDPHAHLIGAGGEQGFGSRQPEMDWAEIARAGV